MNAGDDEAGWRGHGVTRLEAFVDAAFAFAVTLLVISVDRIPDSIGALQQALKNVPAFAASFAMVAMFWYAHVRWSRRYRLGTVPATLLSLLLVFLVLVYVYPLRLLLGTFFAWITGGWLPMPLTDANGARPLAFMFTFYGLAFASMSACIGGLYVLAWRARTRLGLDGEAAANAAGEIASHAYFVGVGLLSVLIACLLGEHARSWQVAMAGSVYFLLSFTGIVHVGGQRWGKRRWPERVEG
ncbi:TMEM175 family protein [Pseudoxanthomonas sp. LjRoot168]|jgi:uncharacterized membrane protein|uniref:TMEM175 family protein n=1 Tax=unclassified Pseudoxanthomonas TaxID=2645906 RepID=UPI002622FDBE|nr:TMEM175 family protein [uncultured Pseudoxanthomonas sp.]